MSKILFPEGFHSGMVTSLSSPGVMPDGTGKVNQGGLQACGYAYILPYIH